MKKLLFVLLVLPCLTYAQNRRVDSLFVNDGIRFDSLGAPSPAPFGKGYLMSRGLTGLFYVNGNAIIRIDSGYAGGGSGIGSLNALTASSQSFVNDTVVTITSSGALHTIGWSGKLSRNRGGTGDSVARNLLGTSSQITVTNGTGVLSGSEATLSLPQNVDTAASFKAGSLRITSPTGELRWGVTGGTNYVITPLSSLSSAVTFYLPQLSTATGTILAGTQAPLTQYSTGVVGITGLSSLGSANTFLGMNAAGTAVEYKFVTAGTNIVVTNSPLSTTIGLTGTVGVGNGGTGLSALPSANRVLSVNTAGSAYVGKVIVGGGSTNVTFSNDTITIMSDTNTSYAATYQGTPEFPRVMNYLLGGGGSSDIYNAADVSVSGYKDTVNLLRNLAKFPDLQVLHSTDWNVGIPFWSGLAADSGLFPPAWRVRTSTGSYLHRYVGHQFVADITQYCADTSLFSQTSAKYQSALATRLMNITNWDYFVGITTDGLDDQRPIPVEGISDIDLDRNGLNDISEVGKGLDWVKAKWKAGWLVFIDSMRSKINARFGDPYAKTISYHSVTDTLGMWGQNGNSLNGAGWEHPFYDRQPNTWDDYIALTKQRNAAGAADREDFNYIEAWNGIDTGRGHAPYYNRNYRFARWMIAGGAMIDAYVGIEDQWTNHYACYRYDEESVDLGYPTTDSDTLSNGVWYRFFENGVVLMNTQNDTVDVFLADISSKEGYDGPYYRFRGGQDTLWNRGGIAWDSTRFLADTLKYVGQDGYQYLGDAIFLTKTKKTVVTDIIVDNAYNATTPGSNRAVATAAWWKDTSAAETQNNPTWTQAPIQDGGGNDSIFARSLRTHVGSGAYDTTVTFTPTIKNTGVYAIYEWHGWSGSSPTHRPEANNVPHVITYSGGADTVYVDQELNVGQWNLLGEYPLAIGTAGNVLISNSAGTNLGVYPLGEWVIADAIKFVYKRAQ